MKDGSCRDAASSLSKICPLHSRHDPPPAAQDRESRWATNPTNPGSAGRAATSMTNKPARRTRAWRQAPDGPTFQTTGFVLNAARRRATSTWSSSRFELATPAHPSFFATPSSAVVRRKCSGGFCLRYERVVARIQHNVPMCQIAKTADSGRASKQIALYVIAKLILQELQFRLGLDAFRQHR